MTDFVKPAIAAIGITIALMMGVGIVNSFYTGVDENVDIEDRDDQVLLDEAGTWVEVIDRAGMGTDETVVNSRGYGLQFTGADDSYLEATSDIEFWSDDSWTISQAVWLDEDATDREMNILAIGDPDVLVRYVPDSPNGVWQVVIIETDNSWKVNRTATDPTNTTIVQVVRDGNTLTIYENNTAGGSVDLSQAYQLESDLTVATNLKGTLEETRTFDDALDNTQRQQLIDNPIDPITNAERTTRLMYDEGSGSTSYILFANVEATVSNATFVSGFDGQEMQRSGMLITRDYDWDDEGPLLRPESGGDLDGAPVAYVTYTFDPDGLVKNFINDTMSAFMPVAAALPLIIIAVTIVTILRRAE